MLTQVRWEEKQLSGERRNNKQVTQTQNFTILKDIFTKPTNKSTDPHTPESGSSLSAVRRRLQKKRQKKNWLLDKQLSLVLISTNRWCSTHSLGGER